MNYIALDFETFFNDDITLRKLNYSAYCHVTTPEIVALVNDATQLVTENMGPALNTIDWTNTTLIGHNLLFDALILKHHFGIQAASYADTLSMARALYPSRKHDLGSLARQFNLPAKGNALFKNKHYHELTPEQQTAYKEYCLNDAIISWQLYHIFENEFKEYELMDHTIKLWLNPQLILDPVAIQAALIEDAELKATLLAQHNIAEKDIRSDKIFSTILTHMGYTPPQQFSDKQQKFIPSFSKTSEAFQTFAEENPELEDLLALKRRVNSNIKQTRSERLLATAALHNSHIPVAYNYHGAFTGRFCLTGDTVITILDCDGVIKPIPLNRLRKADRVWDSEQFVSHDGLLDQGLHYVIHYDGITGTPNHRVFVEELSTLVELQEAKKHGYKLKKAGHCSSKPERSRITWVYDILNCGPQCRFVANGKLVSNSGANRLNLQNLPRGSLLRKAITAPPGYSLVVSDMAQIEARVLAWLAGEQAILDIFTRKDDLYCEVASKIFGRPITKADKDERFVGKCLGPSTIVLTHNGWCHIQDVQLTDKLWDGLEWVSHQGLKAQGVQFVWSCYGLEATASHLFLTAEGWAPWEDLIKRPKLFRSALCDINTPPYKELSFERHAYWDSHPTYDLLSAGPRNRFTIWSHQGPVIVHNSAALGLGYGMGATKFQLYCKLQGRDLSTEFCNSVVQTYRNTFFRIPALWANMGNAIYNLTQPQTTPLSYLTFHNNTIILPSGRFLRYEGLRYVDTSWHLIDGKKVYGAKLVEHVSQAVARDILCEKILTIPNVVMHTHDEIIALIPDQELDEFTQFVHHTMITPPTWAPTLPLNAETHNGKIYGDIK